MKFENDNRTGGLSAYQDMSWEYAHGSVAVEALLRPLALSYSPLLYLSPIDVSTRNHFLIRPTHTPLHVSTSPYGFLVFQSGLQLPTHPHQCFGRIQEAHKERPTQTPPRHQTSILQLSQCHSCCSSPATPRARSVPNKRRTVDTMA